MSLNERISRMLERVREPHDWFEGFDQSVCYGEHPVVDGECPKLEKGVADRCGVCGCFISLMDESESGPSNCPRSEQHKQD